MNKLRIFLIIIINLVLLFNLAGQNNRPTFLLISKSEFSSGSPIEDSSLYIYSCDECDGNLMYVRNQYKLIDYFIIKMDTFYIDELLVKERMEFYRVIYLNRKFLFISSPDFSASGKAYSVYKNYYLFDLDINNKAFKQRKSINSNLDKNSAFKKLVNSK